MKIPQKNRKFVLTFFIVFLATILLSIRLLDGQEYVHLLQTVAVAYLATNVVKSFVKVKPTDINSEDERKNEIK